jgi:serine protease
MMNYRSGITVFFVSCIRKNLFMKLSVLPLLIVALLLTSFAGVSQNKQNVARYFEFPEGAGEDHCMPGKAIVKINPAYSAHCEKNGVTHPAFTGALKKVQASSCVRKFPLHTPPVSKTGKEIDLSLIYEVEFSKQIPVQDAVNSLLSSGILDYAQPRYYVYKLDTIPSDPLNFQQYHLPLIRAFSAWDISMGDTSVVIGITDWGTDVDHPDLVGNFAYNKEDPVDGIDNDNDGYTDNYLGWDMGDNDNNPQETIDHGTRVCGIAAASTSNGTGVSGVGFRCRLLPVKIADAAGYGTMGFEGIVYAADAGCKVINCSWGSVFYPGPYGQDIINYATFNRDALVVAAAGNSGNIDKYFPASYDNVISVAGTNASDLKWSGSTYGIGIDICAPGHNVWSTRNGGSYDYAPGTSFAAPIVSGCAAIVRSYYPSLSAIQTGHLLKVTADVIDTMSGNLPYAGLLGSGRVNLYSALQGVNSPSVEMSPMHYSDHDNNGSFTPGDTISLYGTFTNYLAPSGAALTAVLTSASPFITMIDSVFNPGSIPAMGTATNQAAPFRFLIKQGMPPGSMIDFKITYSDGSYNARQYFFKTLYVNYLTVDTNRVALTLTGNGMLGYNFGNSLQGVGFTYDQHPTMLFSGGLVAGVSSTQVSDVIYGFTGTYDQDFINVQPIGSVNPPSKAEHETITVFNDSLAGNSAMGIQVTQKVMHGEMRRMTNTSFLSTLS